MDHGLLTIAPERRATPAAAVWVLSFAVIAGVALVLAAPILPRWPAAIVYGVASLVCHQRPERSFYWGPVQFAVCARCTGLYAGAALGAVAAVIAGHARLAAAVPAIRRALVIAAIPTAATVAAEWMGMWAPSHAVRALAGLPLGAATAITLAAAAVMTTLHYSGWPHRRGLPPPHPPS
jgi:uncharacterized membrane protein